MIEVLSTTFPIFAIIALGFGLVRFNVFSKPDMAALGKLVMTVALPALLFTTVATRPIASLIQPGYMAVYAIAGLGTLCLVVSALYSLGVGPKRRAVAALGVSCPNSGFVGYPIFLILWPDLAGTILALNFLVENLLIIPICLVLLELSRGKQHGSLPMMFAKLIANVFRRPMMIALVLGSVVALLGIPLPAALTRATSLLGQVAGAVSLIVIGGSLVGLSVRGNGVLALQIAFGKLLLFPALAVLTVWAAAAMGFPLPTEEMRSALILSAALPMFGIFTVLVQDYDQGGAASLAMIVTTATSFVTLSALIYLMV